MIRIAVAFCFYLLLAGSTCSGQQKTVNMNSNTNNPLLCDPEKGICEIPGAAADEGRVKTFAGTHRIRVIYFTDPICSSCWGIEPQLRRLKLEYGDRLELSYYMGGLLPDWTYNSGGISKPSDVAHHWDEVSRYYDMPIDGGVWLKDPLHSSYPPSIAFKAAQLQDEGKAIRFLRTLREMVFLEQKNITRWTHIREAAELAGLDTAQLKEDYEGKAQELFRDDLEYARKLGVRGFPTLLFTDGHGNQERIYGFKPYRDFEQVVSKLLPGLQKKQYDTAWSYLFDKYPTWTSREFTEVSGLARAEAESLLQRLTGEKELFRLDIPNGILWKRSRN